jgi:hypothetical protein
LRALKQTKPELAPAAGYEKRIQQSGTGFRH